jgi:hypothetical protein
MFLLLLMRSIDLSFIHLFENKDGNSQAQGKYLDAARAYDEVLKLAPNVAEVWLNRGGMLIFFDEDDDDESK